MELGMIAIAVLMGLSVAGAAIAQGMVGSKTVEAMILALGLIESLAIYALLIAFMLVGKV